MSKHIEGKAGTPQKLNSDQECLVIKLYRSLPKRKQDFMQKSFAGVAASHH